MDEFKRIAYWTNGRQQPEWQRERGVELGIGDDAAVVALPASLNGLSGDAHMVLAVDTMVEHVHFSSITMADEDIGYKALACNVSDIAAMGAVPLHSLVAVSVPKSYNADRIRRLYDGIYACADKYGVAVIGGDTTSAPAHLTISVTVTGAVEAGRALKRSGARPGDAVFVTGPIGMSAAGLHLLQHAGEAERSEYARLIAAHQRPAPSVRAGRLLLQRGTCTSLNDISDGLASEVWEIAEASGVRLMVDEQALPKSGSMTAYAALAGVRPLDWMLYGGEDYVLTGTVAGEDADEVREAFHREGLPFYIIGQVEAGDPGVELLLSDAGSDRSGHSGGAKARGFGRTIPIEKRGYNHFSTVNG
ncbi:thiamine-phosphate kinase [Paenibacillus sp. J5C_2022]|nr:thiamine-phosphate kinase [Paenibacillus sp. J5C2022]MCU6711823.1 thiamine-phosphate kinase [Paenibacillus sp. J5C2022]